MIETLAKLLANLEGPEWGDLNQDIKSLLQQKLTALNDALTQSKQSEAKDIFDDIEREIFPSLTSEQQTEIHEAIAEAIAPESPSSLRELHWKEKRLIVEQQALHTYFASEWNRYVETMRSANKSRPPITAFISYAWPSYRYPHEQWTQLFIKQLALDLRAVGINVSMDVLDSRFGTNCVRFMQDGVNNSDYIIVVLTESFTYKISNPHCYVKFEYDQIKARIARQITSDKEKTVIPILISGTVLPPNLGVDLRPIIIHKFATNSTTTDPNGGYFTNLIGLINAMYYPGNILQQREIAATPQQAVRIKPATRLSSIYLSETMTNWLYHLLRIKPLAFSQEYKFIQETFLDHQIPFHYYSHQKIIKIPKDNPFFIETHYTPGTANLLTLRQRLFTRNTVTVANPNPTITPHAAISGLGGVGKTQLAIAYMHRYKDLYDLVYWIPADSKGAIIDAYCNLLRQMGEDGNFQSREDIIRRFKAKINDYAEHWLLVYDNVEDAEELTIGDKNLLPDVRAERGHIIITSRSHNWSSRLTIGVFNLEEALHYLYWVVYQNQEYTPPENIAESARELITTLGSLPLALAQTAAYIRREYEEEIAKHEDVFAKYLHEFASSLSQLLHQRLFADDHSKAIVATTWNTTMERLKQKNKVVTQLMQCAAFLAPDDIPAWLLENISKHTSSEVAAGLTLLNQYSLVTFNQETQMVSIHRLVQTIINMQRMETTHHALRLTGDKRTIGDLLNGVTGDERNNVGPGVIGDLLKKSLNIVSSLSHKSEQNKKEYYNRLRSAIPHCNAVIANCYKYIIQATNITHECTSEFVAEIAEFFMGKSNEIGLQFGNLTELMGKISTQLQQYYGINSWESVVAKGRHATYLPAEQAIPIQEELLELIRQNKVIKQKRHMPVFDYDDVPIAIKLSLANNYLATKNFFRAQELLQEMQASSLNLGKTITLKKLWSNFYLIQNQLSLAKPYLEDLYAIFHRKNEHGCLVEIAYSLVLMNIRQRKPEEAIRLITETEQIVNSYFSFEGTIFTSLLAKMLSLLFFLHCNRKDYLMAILSIQKLVTLNTQYQNTALELNHDLINTIFGTKKELSLRLKGLLDLCFLRGDIKMCFVILVEIAPQLINKRFISSYCNNFGVRLQILNLWQQSRANYAQKNVAAAIGNLEEIIDLYTPTGAIYSDFAILHYAQGNITAAQHYFTTALELSPTGSTTNAECALFLYQQQKFDEMREHCLTAIQHTQEIDTLVYGALETFRLDAYLNKERVNSPDQTLTIRPDVLSYYLLIKYYILKNLHSETARYVNEFAHLADSINNALSYRILGQIYTLLADEENAELCYAKALSIPATLYEPSPTPASDPTPATSRSAEPRIPEMRSDSDAYAAAAAILTTIPIEIPMEIAATINPSKKVCKKLTSTQYNVHQGLQHHSVIGDGNCLYRSVTYYLGHGEDVSFLRSMVAANLEHNKAQHADFIPLRDGQSIQDYIAEIRNTPTWAGDVEISILMGLLDRPIVVVGPDGIIRNKDAVNKYFGEKPIFVFYNGGDDQGSDKAGHYDVLLLRDGYDGINILSEMLDPAYRPNISQTFVPTLTTTRDSDGFSTRIVAAPSYSSGEARQSQEAEADDLSAATAQSLLESGEGSLVAARAGQAAAVELLAAPRQSRSTRPPSPPSPTLYALAAPRLALYSRSIGDAPSPSSPPRPSYP